MPACEHCEPLPDIDGNALVQFPAPVAVHSIVKEHSTVISYAIWHYLSIRAMPLFCPPVFVIVMTKRGRGQARRDPRQANRAACD